MTTAAIRKKLVDYVQTVEGKKVKAIFTMVEDDINRHENAADEYTDEFKAELDSRYEEYKNGGTLVSEAEANIRIGNIIRSKAKK